MTENVTHRSYPCGCAASGVGDVPEYCPTHGPAPAHPPAPTGEPTGHLSTRQRQRQLEIIEHAYSGLALCSDHRDKANGRCIVCVAEERTRREFAASRAETAPQADPRVIALCSIASHVAGYIAADNGELSDKLWNAVCAITSPTSALTSPRSPGTQEVKEP